MNTGLTDAPTRSADDAPQRPTLRVDPCGSYRLHPSVAVRPEPFGALVYHYGNRKLVFLKSKRMVAVVGSLSSSVTVADALHVAGVPAAATDRYLDALSSLLNSDMIELLPPASPVEPALPGTDDAPTC